VEAAIDQDTRLLYSESIGNPKNNVDDFPALAAVAHKHGIPFIVDNTVSPPPLFKPFEHGADIVSSTLSQNSLAVMAPVLAEPSLIREALIGLTAIFLN
jgi:O-acetylhomoserine (thiol)-lyase